MMGWTPLFVGAKVAQWSSLAWESDLQTKGVRRCYDHCRRSGKDCLSADPPGSRQRRGAAILAGAASASQPVDGHSHAAHQRPAALLPRVRHSRAPRRSHRLAHDRRAGGRERQRDSLGACDETGRPLMANRATPGSMTPITGLALQERFRTIGAAAFADSMLARVHETHSRCRRCDCRRSLSPATQAAARSIRRRATASRPAQSCRPPRGSA